MFHTASLYRQFYCNDSAIFRAFLHPDRAAVEVGDLPHQRETQPRAALLPAAGLVYAEEGLENASLILPRDAVAGVGDAEQELFRRLSDRNPH